MITKDLEKRPLLYLFLLFAYLGGFAFYWGSMQADLFAVVIITFLMSHFLGNYIAMGYILENAYVYKIAGRSLRLFTGFAINLVIVVSLLSGNQLLYEAGILMYIFNPISFGALYGLLYLMPYLYTLKSVEAQGGI